MRRLMPLPAPILMPLHRLRLRRNNWFLAGATALAWLLASPGLPAQTPAPSSENKGAPLFEEWVVVVVNGKQVGYGSTVTTRSDTPGGPQYHTVHQEEFVVKR